MHLLLERLNSYLLQQGISSRFYDEGAEGHPASLNWHAYFRELEYERLLDRYSSAANEISSRVIKDGSSYLIPYLEVEEFDELEALSAELKSRELCWTDSPVVSLTEFSHLIRQHWARFAGSAGTKGEIYVLEAVFLQHQIHDLLKHYQADDAQIEQHVQGIASSIAALNPILIYLSQPSVREQQIWISTIRSKPRFASEQNIRFMENRKRIELKLLEMLPFSVHVIENVNRNWDEAFSRIISTVETACSPS